MTSRLKTMDKENEIESDWKFAAMVIDRWVMGVMVKKLGSQSTNKNMAPAAMTHQAMCMR